MKKLSKLKIFGIIVVVLLILASFPPIVSSIVSSDVKFSVDDSQGSAGGIENGGGKLDSQSEPDVVHKIPEDSIEGSISIEELPPKERLPDLFGWSFNVTSDSLDLNVSTSFEVEFEIKNNGRAAVVNNPFNVSLWLSYDDNINETSDYFLNESRVYNYIPVGGTTGVITTTLDLPCQDDEFWDGYKLYYVGMIVDSNGEVEEVDEDNNKNMGDREDRDDVWIGPDIPDLSGCFFNVTSDSVELPESGQATIDVEFAIQNTGFTVYDSFNVSFYLSYNDDISTYDEYLENYTVIDGLAAGSTLDIVVPTLSLPHRNNDFWTGTGDGWYYVGMIIDSDEDVDEFDESNNANTGFELDYEGLQVNNIDSGIWAWVDLDVDSDNNNILSNPECSDYEDFIENEDGDLRVLMEPENCTDGPFTLDYPIVTGGYGDVILILELTDIEEGSLDEDAYINISGQDKDGNYILDTIIVSEGIGAWTDDIGNGWHFTNIRFAKVNDTIDDPPGIVCVGINSGNISVRQFAIFPGKLVKYNIDNDDGNIGFDRENATDIAPDMNQNGPNPDEDGELVPMMLTIASNQSNRYIRYKFNYGNTYHYEKSTRCGVIEYTDTFTRVWCSPKRGYFNTNDEVMDKDHTDLDYYHMIWILGDMNNNSELDNEDKTLLENATMNKNPDDSSGTFVDWWNDPSRLFGQYHNYTAVGDMNQDGNLTTEDITLLERAEERTIIRYVPTYLWVEGTGNEGGWSSGYPSRFTTAEAIVYDFLVTEKDKVGIKVVDLFQSRPFRAEFEEYDAGASPVVPMGYPGDTTDFIHDYYCHIGYSRRGSDLKLNTWQTFGQGDFPPRKLDPELSSTPLVSNAVRHFGSQNSYRERETFKDTIDLVTGQQLLQEIDFELPFGGAVFRHVRTYSEISSISPISAPYNGAFWDWNGQNWMMSENPIFLIDANCSLITDELPKRCYFLPDAHHAIPFIYDENLEPPQYIAPPWFDAILTYDPDPRNVYSDFEYPPVKWNIWLNQKSIKYEIEPHYEVLPIDFHYPDEYSDDCGDDYFPNNDDGIPYFGFVTTITDSYGNRVEYDYSDIYQYERDDPRTSNWIECRQNINEFGQLKSIKLRNAEGEVIWTLVYVYRAYGNPDGNNRIDGHDLTLGYDHTLHSIFVYDGDVSDYIPTSSLTIDSKEFWNTSFDSIDDLDAIGSDIDLGLPINWSIMVKYLYNDGESCPTYKLYENSIGPGDDPFSLLKTTVTRRDQIDDDISYEKVTLYRYGKTDLLSTFGNSDMSTLKAIYYPDTVTSIVNSLQQEYQDGGYNVNSLLNFSDTFEVPLEESETGETVNFSFIDLADLFFSFRTDLEASHFVTWATKGQVLHEFFIEDIIGGSIYDPYRVKLRSFGVESFRDHRNGNSTYIFYYYLKYPELSIFSSKYDDGNKYTPFGGSMGASIYHYPYRVFNRSDPLEDSEWVQLPLDQASFITIIDQVNNSAIIPDDLGNLIVNETYGSYDGILNRRVVEMNPSGFILRDRTWLYAEDGEGDLVSQNGSLEHRVYDCYGRLTEIRSNGWDDPENPDENTVGLITNFEYEDSTCSSCDEFWAGDMPDPCRAGELKAISIKSGLEGEFYYIKQFEHEIADRPELVTKEIRYPDPVIDLNILDDAEIVETNYTFNDTEPDPNDWSVTSKTVIKSGIPQTLDGEDCGAMERWIYNDNGNLVWHFNGNINELDEPVEHFFGDYNEYNKYGQKTLEVIDANDSYPPYTFPDDLERNSSIPPLNLTTRYWYDPNHGLYKTQYPDGTIDLDVYVDNTEDDGYCKWEYRGIYNITGEWEFVDSVTINHYEGVTEPIEVSGSSGLLDLIMSFIGGGSGSTTTYNLVLIEKVNVTLDDKPDGNEEYEVLSTTTPEYDEHGNTVGIETKGSDGASASTKITRNGFGDITRQEAADGTITRYVYDELGRKIKTYQGTKDKHPFWGIGNPWDFTSWLDNMVLTEKQYYAQTGVKNAGKLIQVRHTNTKPINQYFEVDELGESIPSPNNENEIGWFENIFYDWRMREVSREFVDAEGLPFKYEFTWKDNQDRVILNAVYSSEAGVPPHVDPRDLPPGWNLTKQNISDILNTSKAINGIVPISLTETVFNRRGLVEETREYNIDSGADAAYLSTMTFYDFKDRAVEERSPNSPVKQDLFNAKDQKIRSSQWAAGYEITRTETVYDDDNRAIKTINWERKHTAGPGELTPDNSIKTYSYTWYNKTGKVIAEANYGTNSTDNTFTTGDEPEYDEDNPPRPGSLGDDIQVTCYEYDEAGNNNVTYNPDGTVTRKEFNDLGREILVTENAFDRDGDGLVRHTAYYFDSDTGQLMKMAAVLLDHIGHDDILGVANWSDINWSAEDGTLQVTELKYNADVIDSELKALNFDGNNDYIHIPTDDNLRESLNSLFSISVWFNADDIQQESSIVEMRNQSGLGWRLLIKDGNLSFSSKNDTGFVSLNSSNIDTSFWHHVVITYNVEGCNASLYLDGLLVDTQISGITHIPYEGTEELMFGKTVGSNDQWFAGQIEDISLYHRCLTIEEIQKIYRDRGYIPSLSIGGVKASWKMDEGQDEIIYDTSDNPHQNNGILGGDGVGPDRPTWVSDGFSAYALKFDGDDDYVDCENHASLRPANKLTLEAWIYIRDFTSYAGIVNNVWDNGGQDRSGYGLNIHSDDSIQFVVKTDGTSAWWGHCTSQISPNEWHHVVGVYDGSKAWLFIDGEEVKNFTATGIIDYNPINNVRIGKYEDSSEEHYFNGTIDEVKIYNHDLTPDEVRDRYENSSLIGYWKLNESSGDIAIDSSSKGNNGIIHSANWSGHVVSSHGSWISEVRYPDKITGQPSLNDRLRFKYYFDGNVASKIDAKGTIYYYTYDELGNLIETFIDDSYYYDPDGQGESIWAPENRTHKITYNYTSDNLPTNITAYTKTNGIEEIVSQNIFEYDSLGNLINEYQAHNGAVDEFTSVVNYEWEFNSSEDGRNFNRLKKITYPKRHDDNKREVIFHYGTIGDLDDGLCRITAIEDNDSAIGEVANYTYAGLDRRIELNLGGGAISQDFICGSITGYTGLNQFGQITDLDFRNSAEDILFRSLYGYDINGNRLYANVTQRDPYVLGTTVNDRSFNYSYDALQRLINADMGQLDSNNENIIPDAPIPLTRFSEWKLDNLGNWANGDADSGSMIRQDFMETGSVTESRVHHDVNQANQITTITKKTIITDREAMMSQEGSENNRYYIDFDQFVATTGDVEESIWLGSTPSGEDEETYNTILITDQGNDRVIEVNKSKNIIWQDNNELYIPYDAERLDNVNTLTIKLVTTTHLKRNHRVIEINKDGGIDWQYSARTYVPVDVERLDNGNTLIALMKDDESPGRVIEVDNNQQIIWEIDGLDSPVDAERLSSGSVLITDQDSHRVFVYNLYAYPQVDWEMNETHGLNVPVDAERLDNDNILITDCGNQRVIEVNYVTKAIEWEMTATEGLGDPVDAEQLDNGNILITDSWNHRVIEVNYTTKAIEWEMNETHGLYYPVDAESVENNPPFAEISGPPSGKVNQLINFDGSGSYDMDEGGDSIERYDWRYNDSDSWYIDEGPTASHLYTVEDEYNVSLCVIDDEGTSSIVNYTISIYEGDPPIADAGGDYYGVINIPVIFNCSNSDDTDGTVEYYRWDFDNDGNWDTSGVEDEWVDFSNPEYDYTYTSDYEGYAILEVKDDEDMTDFHGAWVEISEDPSDDVSYETVYDQAGNLVFDGIYIYQYDGFNRLMQVNHHGSINANDFDGEGRIISGSIGHIVVSYINDGLGRLIHKEMPITFNPIEVQVEDYFYDGVRRIQEIINVGTTIVEQEYIYGPDYVDEFICQIDNRLGSDRVTYMLQDANYNVVALVNNTGTVIEQYTYNPYGTLAHVDTFDGGETIVNRVGHQGLFFERLDDPNGSPLNTSAFGLYYNRNRWYNPTLGRFIQRDPIEAASPILIASLMNGDIPQYNVHMFNLQGHYVNGMNLYQYCGSNPVNLKDPSGAAIFMTLLIIAIIGALIGVLIGSLIAWFNGYSLGDSTFWYYVLVGALIGAGVSVLVALVLAKLGLIVLFSSPGCITGIQLFGYKLMLHWGHEGKGIHFCIQQLVSKGWKTIKEWTHLLG